MLTCLFLTDGENDAADWGKSMLLARVRDNLDEFSDMRVLLGGWRVLLLGLFEE
jgi:hypothetical protein